MIFFSDFHQKTEFDISCRLSLPRQFAQNANTFFWEKSEKYHKLLPEFVQTVRFSMLRITVADIFYKDTKNLE